MANTLYFFALSATLAALTSAQSCSEIERQFPIPSPQCGRVKSSSLTSAEKQEILHLHNKYRARVASGRETRGNPGPQPAATNLGPLKWDNKLAQIAQAWANQCSYGHNSCPDTVIFGQNIARDSSSERFPALEKMVTRWYDEVAQFNRNKVPKFYIGDHDGHYTQMVWAKTTHVGCGAIRYNNDGWMNRTFLVCNYGPVGNVWNFPIYKTR